MSAENVHHGTPVSPPPVAAGRNGRWVDLGHVGVDSAALAITDPAMIGTTPRGQLTSETRSAPFGLMGIQLWSGFGDGEYTVWGWVADYGSDGNVDERVGQITVTMIDDHDLAQWHRTPCPRCTTPCANCSEQGCDSCNWDGRQAAADPCK